MNKGNVLRKYVLSQCTEDKLNVIKERLKDNIFEADPLWETITGKKQAEYKSEEESIEEGDNVSKDNICNLPNDQLLFTQFYCTQVQESFGGKTTHTVAQKSDIIESLLEELEHTNGKLDFNQLESISDDELIEVISDLEKRMSASGIYNLCCSINNMNLEQRMKYAAVVYTHLLLPQIIAAEEPSRLLLSIITEFVQKFPDDIEKFIFVPLLNIDLKNITAVNAIANSFDPQRNNVLIREYLLHVRELKSWHLPILQMFFSAKTDQVANDKFIRLLSEKAVDFAKDKHFGKLLLTFVKVNENLTEQQKQLLLEITEINETLFKKPIIHKLKTL